MRDEYPKPYTVAKGDNLANIAIKHGFGSDWQAIYYADENAAFRQKRPKPSRIVAGDTLMIPDPDKPRVSGGKNRIKVLGEGYVAKALRFHEYYMRARDLYLNEVATDAEKLAVASWTFHLLDMSERHKKFVKTDDLVKYTKSRNTALTAANDVCELFGELLVQQLRCPEFLMELAERPIPEQIAIGIEVTHGLQESKIGFDYLYKQLEEFKKQEKKPESVLGHVLDLISKEITSTTGWSPDKIKNTIPGVNSATNALESLISLMREFSRPAAMLARAENLTLRVYLDVVFLKYVKHEYYALKWIEDMPERATLESIVSFEKKVVRYSLEIEIKFKKLDEYLRPAKKLLAGLNLFFAGQSVLEAYTNEKLSSKEWVALVGASLDIISLGKAEAQLQTFLSSSVTRAGGSSLGRLSKYFSKVRWLGVAGGLASFYVNTYGAIESREKGDTKSARLSEFSAVLDAIVIIGCFVPGPVGWIISVLGLLGQIVIWAVGESAIDDYEQWLESSTFGVNPSSSSYQAQLRALKEAFRKDMECVKRSPTAFASAPDITLQAGLERSPDGSYRGKFEFWPTMLRSSSVVTMKYWHGVRGQWGATTKVSISGEHALHPKARANFNSSGVKVAEVLWTLGFTKDNQFIEKIEGEFTFLKDCKWRQMGMELSVLDQAIQIYGPLKYEIKLGVDFMYVGNAFVDENPIMLGW